MYAIKLTPSFLQTQPVGNFIGLLNTREVTVSRIKHPPMCEVSLFFEIKHPDTVSDIHAQINGRQLLIVIFYVSLLNLVVFNFFQIHMFVERSALNPNCHSEQLSSACCGILSIQYDRKSL